MKNRVLIVGIDTFARKNQLQVSLAENIGYSFDVITRDSMGNSNKIFEPFLQFGSKIYSHDNGILSTLIVFFRCLLKQNYHHVELYPAGKLGFFFALVLWLFRYRFFVIERGDVAYLRDYPVLVRFSILLSYKLASGIIYKETYMKNLLEGYGARKLYFLPNCVEGMSKSDVPETKGRNGFLWVNRIIRLRKPSWLLRAFASKELSCFEVSLVGLRSLDKGDYSSQDTEIELLNLAGENRRLYSLQEPFDFYKSHRFFCFPSEIVFGNNALLEAMSYGLIPIITKAPGVELIIEDGVNGVVTELGEDEYKKGLIRASRFTEAEVEQMSARAMDTIVKKYSPDIWINRLKEIYSDMTIH